jgi:hypothetical protein
VLATEYRVGVVAEQSAQDSSLRLFRVASRRLEGAVMEPLLSAERVSEQPPHVIPPW